MSTKPNEEKCMAIFYDESIEVYEHENVVFKTNNTEMSDEIKQEYIKHYKEKAKPQALKSLVVFDDGESDFVDTRYDTEQVPFQRIRRVTGYLVGDMSRWNNGKKAEEADRVKHS